MAAIQLTPLLTVTFAFQCARRLRRHCSQLHGASWSKSSKKRASRPVGRSFKLAMPSTLVGLSLLACRRVLLADPSLRATFSEQPDCEACVVQREKKSSHTYTKVPPSCLRPHGRSGACPRPEGASHFLLQLTGSKAHRAGPPWPHDVAAFSPPRVCGVRGPLWRTPSDNHAICLAPSALSAAPGPPTTDLPRW